MNFFIIKLALIFIIIVIDLFKTNKNKLKWQTNHKHNHRGLLKLFQNFKIKSKILNLLLLLYV